MADLNKDGIDDSLQTVIEAVQGTSMAETNKGVPAEQRGAVEDLLTEAVEGYQGSQQAGQKFSAQLSDAERKALELFDATTKQVEAEGEVLKLSAEETHARAVELDKKKNQIATDLELEIVNSAMGWSITEEMQNLEAEYANLEVQRKQLRETPAWNPIGVLTNMIQVALSQERVAGSEKTLAGKYQLQVQASAAATAQAQAASTLGETADSTATQAAKQRLADAKIAVAKAQAGQAYNKDIATVALQRYNITGQDLQNTLSILGTINQVMSTKRMEKQSELEVLKDFASLGQASLTPGHIQMFVEKTGQPAQRFIDLPATARGMWVNYVTGGQVISDSPTKEELVAASSMADVLPDPFQREITKSLNIRLNKIREAGGDGRLISKVTLDSTGAGKVSGGDIQRENLFTTKIPIVLGGTFVGDMSVTDLLSEAAFKRPGGFAGKAFYSAPELAIFAQSNKPGAGIVKEILTRMQAGTIDANTELNFTALRQIAKNQPRDIYGYFKEMQKQATLRVPYALYGAKPREVGIGIPLQFNAPSDFGGHQPVSGSFTPTSVEDVVTAMQKQDIGEQLKQKPFFDPLSGQMINPASPATK